MRFRNFDPYKEDKERALHERGQETKKFRDMMRYHKASNQKFAALARRKKRPITLAPIKGS